MTLEDIFDRKFWHYEKQPMSQLRSVAIWLTALMALACDDW